MDPSSRLPPPALHATSVRTGRRRRHVCSSQSARGSAREQTDLAQFAPVAAHCLQHDARRHVGRNQETKRVLRLMRRLRWLPFCRRRQTPPPLLGRKVPRSGEIDRRGSQRGASSSLKCGSNKLGEGGQRGAVALLCLDCSVHTVFQSQSQSVTVTLLHNCYSLVGSFQAAWAALAAAPFSSLSVNRITAARSL